MKVVLSGAPLFTKKLLEALNNSQTQNRYVYCNIKGNIFQRLHCYYHILSSDILFVTYVDSLFIKSVDFALKLKKKVILSWIGSDVMNALPLIKNNTFNRRYIEDTNHVAVSQWLIEELNSVNIFPKYLTIYLHEDKKRNIQISDKFTVLTYVSKNREKFYGIDTFIKLANDFPYIEFRIAGITQYENIPNNIKLLGWVDMDKEYENCTVYVRYPKHDGEAHSVLEALGYGKVVFFNYDYSYVNYVTNYGQLKDGIKNTYETFLKGELTPNQEAIEYINNKYSKQSIVKQYEKLFNEI